VLAAGVPSASPVKMDVLEVLWLVPGQGNRMDGRAKMAQLFGINWGNWGEARTKGSGETLSVLKMLHLNAKKSARDKRMQLLRGWLTKEGSEDKQEEQNDHIPCPKQSDGTGGQRVSHTFLGAVRWEKATMVGDVEAARKTDVQQARVAAKWSRRRTTTMPSEQRTCTVC
jgi:hypothetical protein